MVNDDVAFNTINTMRLVTIRISRLLGFNGLSSLKRKVLYIFTCAILLLILYRLMHSVESDLEISLLDEEDMLGDTDSEINAEKWVVITTIRLPTDAVRMLAEQPGWKMVVVGDTKTPSSWRLPNVIFLNLKLQKSLGYRILKFLPFNTYARKSIGYLYAIQHGAKYIYETDDDNFPTYGLSGFHSSQNLVSRLVLSTNNITSNPYVHFGQSTLWPRGYPLDRVGAPAERRYQLCEMPSPPIQQGVVNGDPDVDAVFRLTRRQSSTSLKLTFDRAAPPFVLPARTFAPFNSQNTFFSSRAMWALVLPVISVPDRAADIYRAYWAQRLLWLIGDGVAFAPPNAIQTRNQHSDLVDARDEAGLYQEMSRYIRSLDQWQCTEGSVFLFDCISQLSRHLVKEGFWQSGDADTVDAWLADLTSVGYSPPVLYRKPPAIVCDSEGGSHSRVAFYPVEQNTSMPHTNKLYVPRGSTSSSLISARIASICGTAHKTHWESALVKAPKYPNILLVISVPKNIHSVLPTLEAIYRIHFPNILYCVQNRVDDSFIDRWRISVVWLKEDVSGVPCLLAARRMEFGVRGFLHVSWNMLVNAGTERMLTRVDSLVWMPGEFDAYQQSTMSLCYRKAISCRHMSRDVLTKALGLMNTSPKLTERQKGKLRTCVAKLERDPSLVQKNGALWISDMMLYVPERLIARLALLRDILTAELDVLAVLMLECEQLTVNYMQRDEHIDGRFVDSGTSVDYILPFAFDVVADDDESKKPFCSYFERYGSIHPDSDAL